MAIDIRATVTCSLGTLISGSISDDYLQGSGLVKTRGSCEISALITPTPGTVVTFSYTKNGVTTNLPRKLRVLSSFADPYRRTTKVELGCKLTYLSDYRPAPTVDGEPAVETGKRQQCQNGYIDWPANAAYGVPIDANTLLTTCLDRLDITAASNPLTNKFYRDSFDLGAGYVAVINDLLLSESYFGYLDFNEVLQIKTLDEQGGSGPVISSADIVDLGPIGTGQLPGDAVVVRYDSMVLNEDLKEETEEADAQIISERNWEEDSTVGARELVEVRYTSSDGNVYTNTYYYIPYSVTQTQYGEDASWDDTTCIIASSAEEGANLKDSVIKRIVTQNVLKAKEANDYCAQALSAGFQPNGGAEGQLITEEFFEYDSKGQLVRKITDTYEPYFMWAGRIDVQFIYANANGSSSLVLLDESDVLTRRVIEETTTLYAELPSGNIYLDPGEEYERLVNGQKIVTVVYENYVRSQQGQQAVAGIQQNAPFDTASQCASYLLNVSRKLVLVDSTVQVSRNRILVGIQRRPPVELRLGLNGQNFRSEFKSELLYSYGDASAKRIIELSMPLQSDDYYAADGSIVKGDAQAKAQVYGRVQNRLLLGNRSGMNVQLAPERLPAAPFAPIYIQASGLTAVYRANGNQWAFDSNGIVCSTDALFWGAAGGTGTFWFPVAPGIVALPPEPPIVDGQMNASNIVLPYNETAVYSARLTLGAAVAKFDYALGLLTEVDPFVLTLGVTVYRVKLLASDAAALTLTGQAAVLKRGLRVGAAATSFALSGYGAGSVRNFVIGTNAGTFTVTGQPAGLTYQRLPLSLAATSFVLTGQNAQFSYTQGGLAGQVGVFTATGQSAALVRNAILTSAAGSITAAGQAAGLAAYQSKTAVMYYTGNASTQSVTGAGFTPGFVALKRRNASSTNGWYNNLRGVTNYIRAGENFSEQGLTTGLTSFNSDGFSLGSNTFFNASSAPYVALAFPTGGSGVSNTNGSITTTTSAQQDTEFSVFTYTGTGGTSSQTLGHGLSGAPDLVIIKPLASGGVFVGSPLIGTDLYMGLGSTSATPTSSTTHIKAFNSTTITIGSSLNTSSASYVVFATKAKSGTTNIDSFTGAGTATHTVTLGYTPKALLLKNISTTTGDWLLCYRPSGGTGYVNTTSWSNGNAELTSTTVQFTSTGFSVDVGGPGNVSGGTTKALYWAMF